MTHDTLTLLGSIVYERFNLMSPISSIPQMTAEQAEVTQIIEATDDRQYCLAVTLESPDLALPHETVTDWVDDLGMWNSHLVYWWLCELGADGLYHAIEFCETCEEYARDIWTVYAEDDGQAANAPFSQAADANGRTIWLQRLNRLIGGVA